MPSTQIDRIDGVSTSMAVKVACRAGTLGNITLSGLQTVDGIALAANDRVLVKNQSNAVTNGIYTAQTTSWVREPDFDGARDAVQGTTVQIENGTIQALTWWNVTTPNPFVIAQDAVNFGQTFISLTPVSQATETAAGIAEIATQAETNTGTDDLRFVTPLKLAGAISRAGPAAVVSTGSANAYVVTYSPTIGALVTGKVYPWITNFANTAACTVNINGTGAKPIKTIIGADPPSGYIPSGSPILTLYDGTNMVIISAQTTGLISTVTFNASGTYTKNPAARYIIIDVIGGGASGGGTATTPAGNSAAGGGGGGGGYSRQVRLNSAVTPTVAVTVGAAGAPGTAGSNPGNPGGTSSFGALVQATGGAAGSGSVAGTVTGTNSNPAAGGVGSLGDINAQGGSGDFGFQNAAGNGGLGGGGGSSFFGAGAPPSAAAPGLAAITPGSGGSGASAPASTAARSGGTGANGIVIIREYA